MTVCTSQGNDKQSHEGQLKETKKNVDLSFNNERS